MGGAEMGKLVGLIDGIEGQKFPAPEVLDVLTKLHATEIYVDGSDLDEWLRGFKAAYRLTWTNAPPRAVEDMTGRVVGFGFDSSTVAKAAAGALRLNLS